MHENKKEPVLTLSRYWNVAIALCCRFTSGSGVEERILSPWIPQQFTMTYMTTPMWLTLGQHTCPLWLVLSAPHRPFHVLQLPDAPWKFWGTLSPPHTVLVDALINSENPPLCYNILHIHCLPLYFSADGLFWNFSQLHLHQENSYLHLGFYSSQRKCLSLISALQAPATTLPLPSDMGSITLVTRLYHDQPLANDNWWCDGDHGNDNWQGLCAWVTFYVPFNWRQVSNTIYNTCPINTSLYPMRMLELIRGSPLGILFKEQREKEDLEEEMSRWIGCVYSGLMGKCLW